MFLYMYSQVKYLSTLAVMSGWDYSGEHSSLVLVYEQLISIRYVPIYFLRVKRLCIPLKGVANVQFPGLFKTARLVFSLRV